MIIRTIAAAAAIALALASPSWAQGAPRDVKARIICGTKGMHDEFVGHDFSPLDGKQRIPASPPTIVHPATSLGPRCAIATSPTTIRAPVDPPTVDNRKRLWVRGEKSRPRSPGAKCGSRDQPHREDNWPVPRGFPPRNCLSRSCHPD